MQCTDPLWELLVAAFRSCKAAKEIYFASHLVLFTHSSGLLQPSSSPTCLQSRLSELPGAALRAARLPYGYFWAAWRHRGLHDQA